MQRAIGHVLQADVHGLAVVLGSFFQRLADSRDHVDVVLAAGVALEELQELGQVTGKPETNGLKPI